MLHLLVAVCSVGYGGNATVFGVFRKLGSHKKGSTAAPLFQLPSLQRQQTACVCQGKVITASFNTVSPYFLLIRFTYSELGHKNVGSIFIGYDASVPVVKVIVKFAENVWILRLSKMSFFLSCISCSPMDPLQWIGAVRMMANSW